MNPIQRSPDDSRVTWIFSKTNGKIVIAHYTYGRVSSCDNVTVLYVDVFCYCLVSLVIVALMQVAAVISKVECAIMLGHTSVTSQSCKWNDVLFMKVV